MLFLPRLSELAGIGLVLLVGCGGEPQAIDGDADTGLDAGSSDASSEPADGASAAEAAVDGSSTEDPDAWRKSACEDISVEVDGYRPGASVVADVDAAGNLLMALSAGTTATFEDGSTRLPPDTPNRRYVDLLKFDRECDLLWAKRVDTPDNGVVVIQGFDVDHDGRSVIQLWINYLGSDEERLLAVSPEGEVQWTLSLEGDVSQMNGVTFLSDGAIGVGGLQAACAQNGEQLVRGSCVARVSTDGQIDFAHWLPGSSYLRVSAGPMGQLSIAGTYESAWIADETLQTGDAPYDPSDCEQVCLYAARVDPSGTWLQTHSRPIESSSAGTAGGLTVDDQLDVAYATWLDPPNASLGAFIWRPESSSAPPPLYAPPLPSGALYARPVLLAGGQVALVTTGQAGSDAPHGVCRVAVGDRDSTHLREHDLALRRDGNPGSARATRGGQLVAVVHEDQSSMGNANPGNDPLVDEGGSTLYQVFVVDP